MSDIKISIHTCNSRSLSQSLFRVWQWLWEFHGLVISCSLELFFFLPFISRCLPWCEVKMCTLWVCRVSTALCTSLLSSTVETLGDSFPGPIIANPHLRVCFELYLGFILMNKSLEIFMGMQSLTNSSGMFFFSLRKHFYYIMISIWKIGIL